MGCIFCKIIKKEIPSTVVYENEEILAFMDIAPTSKGHTLIISKEHYETVLDMPEEALCKLTAVSKKICKAVYEATKADGFNFSMNNYAASGQAVPHVHFHVIPRFDNDGLSNWPRGKYEEGEAEEFADKIKKLL